ncbi:MAG: nicotinate-nucleotide adenylyltransferase, partial [Actinomycetota bacterium]|nr:nicotinate-nucleotide adenylyltransferase [Actinomycetota bacterium]
MGGTFDPIHHGHLVAAAQVSQGLGLDEVVFVPTGEPWQKRASRVSDAEHRFLMTLLATVGNPTFAVSRVDIERPGPTYAVDTLADLRAAYGPSAQLFFITGADALAAITSWRDHERIFALARLVGVTRPGHELAAPGVPPGAVTMLEVSALAISSTECRRRVAAGLTLDYLVPADVAAYI